MVGVVTVPPAVDGAPPTPARSRPGAVGTGSAALPPSPTAGSTCPAFSAAASTVDDAVRCANPVLVLGEAGSGRGARRRARVGGPPPPGGTGARAPPELGAAPRAGAAPPPGTSTGSVLHVVRDLDRVPDAAVTAFLEHLRRAEHDIGLFAATSAETIGGGGAQQGLLGLFRACATVPPLCHRGPDLPGLVTVLLAELAPHRDLRLTREALRVLTAYRWPGNVAQLRSALADAVRARPVGAIEVTDLPTYCQSTPRRSLRPVDEVQRDAIVAGLRDAGGNRKAAAAALGFARSTLYRKIREYGITD